MPPVRQRAQRHRPGKALAQGAGNRLQLPLAASLCLELHLDAG